MQRSAPRSGLKQKSKPLHKNTKVHKKSTKNISARSQLKPPQFRALSTSPYSTTAHFVSTTAIQRSMAPFSMTPFSNSLLSSSSKLPHSSPLHNISQRHLFIQTQTTPNPRSLKFVPGKDVLGEKEDGTPNTVFFDQSQRANARRQSSLAYSLLLIDGVMNVMLGADFVTVTTTDDNQDWMIIKPMVYAGITDAYATDEPILKSIGELEASRELPTLPGDEEAVALIKEIIDHRIRPTVMDDGGDVEFIQFDKQRTVWLLMKGSCSGCPSSGATLKQGIQNMIMHYVPEVQSVDEWKDEVALISDDAFQRLEAKLAEKSTDEKH